MRARLARLWALPPRWRVLLMFAIALPVIAYLGLVVRPGSHVGHSGAMTVTIDERSCTNIGHMEFEGQSWISDTSVPESWGYGIENGRFHVLSSHTAEFVSDADGKSVDFYRLPDGKFSSLHCGVGFGA